MATDRLVQIRELDFFLPMMARRFRVPVIVAKKS